ncbi:hypothetical protein K450DRAFT_259704 [Umbelopsis ramanniana AG]|uniref:Uncharacterized protein n=1 Tax=Umbelopsis ramanniana AG TaxID=1314678 RepID=A0AAD5E1E9_UMBRA|nr:uncharacterized protein K450DRAFT_259704 [Umbelopsis ramanniana AG]KAI8575893.1 hypothetical protein K450DRAFT_259704 [Umbelopsis ramanniana AG]
MFHWSPEYECFHQYQTQSLQKTLQLPIELLQLYSHHQQYGSVQKFVAKSMALDLGLTDKVASVKVALL